MGFHHDGDLTRRSFSLSSPALVTEGSLFVLRTMELQAPKMWSYPSLCSCGAVSLNIGSAVSIVKEVADAREASAF